MAQEDWKTAITFFVITLLILKYFVNTEEEHETFKICSTGIKYHSNWTNSDAELHHVKQLQDAYKLQGIKWLDLSLSMSALNFSRVKELLPVRFQPYQSISINLANNPIGTEGADYVLSLLPNGVSELSLAFDAINADDQLGAVLAKRLNNLNSLKKLKLSLIMSIKNDSVLDDFLRFGRLGQRLQSYSLVLIGNSLTANSLGFLKTHLSRANLKDLELNFYANKLQMGGAEVVAESILSQKGLRELNLDFYFNNITENGTEAVSKSILEINHPELKTLNLNLDFNYIKNEGGKALGKALSKMTNLRSLSLGVASKNFGYLGFKYIINGLSSLVDLEEFSLRCGINRVGANGAEVTRDLVRKMKNLRRVSLNFYENYVGDEGLIDLTRAVTELQNVESIYLNFGFNDAKGYGLIKCLELLAKKAYKELFVSFSSNEFQDSEVNLIKDQLRAIIKKTKSFQMQFMETAISKKKAAELERLFSSASRQSGYSSSINVNSVITEEQETKYTQTSKDREEKLQELIEKDKKDEVSGSSKPTEASQKRADVSDEL